VLPGLKTMLQTNPRGVEGGNRWTGKPNMEMLQTNPRGVEGVISFCGSPFVDRELQTNPRGVEGLADSRSLNGRQKVTDEPSWG